MSGFKPGNTFGKGRPKGVRNRISLQKVDEYLAERGINPIEEILKLLPMLDPREQVKVWGGLLPYLYRKPTEEPALNEEPIRIMTAEENKELHAQLLASMQAALNP